MISTFRNRRMAAYMSCSVRTETRNKLIYVGTTSNQLELVKTTTWKELEPPGKR